MIFQVGAVLAFVVFRTVAAEVIVLVIEALGPVLARVGLAIIHVQLYAVVWGGKRETVKTVSLQETKGSLLLFPLPQAGHTMESDLLSAASITDVQHKQYNMHQHWGWW